MELTLKRGSGLTFDGTNWNLVSEKKWGVQVLLVPNGKEKYMGNRTFGGVEHAVFQCLNDEYFAQPVSVCKLPKPDDPGEVVYTLEPPPPEVEKPRSSKVTQGVKVLQFAGKNWKLAADKKWKSTTSFSTFEESTKVGEKTIGQTVFDVYKASNTSFFAVKREE
jgi:hypothetical protein